MEEYPIRPPEHEMSIDQAITWRGKPYKISGYATHGKTLYIVWLKSIRGQEIRLVGKELQNLKGTDV